MNKTALTILCLVFGLGTLFFGFQYFRNLDIIQEREGCKRFASLIKEYKQKHPELSPEEKEKKDLIDCNAGLEYAQNYRNRINEQIDTELEPAGFIIPNSELVKLILEPGNQLILVMGRHTPSNETCIILFPKDKDESEVGERRASFTSTRETFPPLRRKIAAVNYPELFNCTNADPTATTSK